MQCRLNYLSIFRIVGLILMPSDTWIKKACFRSETKSGFPILFVNNLFDSNFFDREIRSTHPAEKLETVGIEKTRFQQFKKASVCLRPGSGVFDPCTRLRNNWGLFRLFSRYNKYNTSSGYVPGTIYTRCCCNVVRRMLVHTAV